MTDRFTRWTLRAGALFVIALAAWSRATLRAAVFIDGETYPLDTDCHYHLRRALRTLEHFPRVPVRDPWINWPHGATPTWGPGFDQLLALPAWLAGAAGDVARASRIIAWVPFVLGLFVVVATMHLARALDPDEGDRDATALAAGAFAATLPIASLTSMAGRVDHHVFEALTTALVALWLARPPALRTPWRFEVAGALAVLFTVHTFTGTLLQWGLAAAALAARALFDETSPRSPRESVPGSGAVALALGGALVALCDLGWIREQGDLFHHLQLSFLQPLVLVGGGIFVGTLAAVSGKVAPRGTWPTAARRLGLALLGLAPVAALGMLAFPALFHEVRAGLVDWLATRDPWMHSIAETAPLFQHGSVRGALDEYGALVFTAPFLFPLALRRAARRGRDELLALAVVGGGTIALALLQRRFGRSIPPVFAAWTALGLMEAFTLVRARVGRLTPTFTRAAPFALALAWSALDPNARAVLEPLRGRWITGVHEAARFLRGRPPPVVVGQRPAVFAHWTVGFEVLTLGRRPVLVTGYGHYTSRATWDDTQGAWYADEARMLGVLDRHDASYVMFPSVALMSRASAQGTLSVKRSTRGGHVLNSAFLREVPIAALLLGGSGAEAFGVSHVAHLRPIFVDRSRIPGLNTAIPETWVYERVAGATLQGAAPDGTRVLVTLPLRLRTIERRWEAWTVARDGRWSLTVPFATSWDSRGGVATGERYTITYGDAVTAQVVVPDDAVRTGAVIDAPTR